MITIIIDNHDHDHQHPIINAGPGSWFREPIWGWGGDAISLLHPHKRLEGQILNLNLIFIRFSSLVRIKKWGSVLHNMYSHKGLESQIYSKMLTFRLVRWSPTRSSSQWSRAEDLWLCWAKLTSTQCGRNWSSGLRIPRYFPAGSPHH